MFFNELSFSFRLVRIVSLNSDYYRMYVFNIDWTEAVVVWVTRIIQHLTVIELLLARYNGKSVLQPNVPRGWWGGLTFILQIMWKEEFLSIIFFYLLPSFSPLEKNEQLITLSYRKLTKLKKYIIYIYKGKQIIHSNRPSFFQFSITNRVCDKP